jgi:hypothetical protein
MTKGKKNIPKGKRFNCAGSCDVAYSKKHMKAFFQQLRILYFALLAGQLGFLFVIFMLKGQPSRMGLLTLDNPLPLLSVGLMFVAVLVAYGLNEKRKALGAQSGGNLAEKAEHYRSVIIFRCALTEAANMVALVLAFLNGDGIFFLVFAAGVVAFLYFRPDVREFLRDYNLKPAEYREVEEAFGLK